MRLMHRTDDHVDTEAGEPAADHESRRRSGLLARFRRGDRGDRGERADGSQADRDAAARREAARRKADRRDDTARDDTAPVREPRERVQMKRWDVAAFLTAAFAVALGVVGGAALVRTGVDGTWYSPTEQVARIDHTAALGAVEVGVALLVLLPLLIGLRMVAALVALAAGAVAAVAAIDPGDISADLALERGWAVGLAVAGIALGLLLVATRERVKHIERRPARPRGHGRARDDRDVRPA